ncbi:hypothetical protein CERSUDRAFT_151114 [Gelatoporia subvermispora B]|uniref:Cytochrome P450 n=1 Tax=Ceriporiopsis subvermispora (strain B) TaxID=914234 RepID=M2QSX0_CERS8|nr:hypothetical protein CERSUDRAFT_151114 [Gelatoporia subvermispora B]
MLLSIALALSAAAAVVLLLLRKRAKASANPYHNLPCPPGPKPMPLIGNALDVPSEYAWRTYAQWTDKYGDIICTRLFGNTIIILNSLEAATDLLEKRSANYSDRLMTETVRSMGWDWNTAMMEYGQKWRNHRRLFHQYFNQGAVKQYEPQDRVYARKLLKRLYDEPKNFAHDIRYLFGANILSVAYGFEVAEKNDKHIEVSEEAMFALAAGGLPGSFLVDLLPFLKHFPSWAPGAGYKKITRQWNISTTAMKELPWSNAKDPSSPSVAARLCERMAHIKDGGDEEAIREAEETSKNVAAVAYTGGVDTTVSTLTSFVLAMVLYPDVQKRAQAELAKVVGPERLPDFSDKESLPYIEAICKEAMRWQPVLPLGVAHRCVADDEYRGYQIPAGALMLQNTWAILHDPVAYPEDPEAFMPERFLKDGEINPEIRDPGVAAFGAGRRTCPGRHFSDMSLYINVAYILHTFDITPAIDANGRAILPKPKMTSGMLSYPMPFECTIKPRGTWAEKLILGRED